LSPDRSQRRPIDHELLLAQAGWVRGLAGTLVRDPVGADDVAQETMLAALTRPPLGTDERSLRAWLARVVTNLSRLALRRNARRERREELAARPMEVAPAAEALERAAMLQRVLDAVLELDEPYRSTVLLRYFEGLDSREVGDRLGVSPEAVRKRLSRGLERLRRRLDQEHGGDRSAWSAAFLPWAAAQRLPLTVPAAPIAVGMPVVWALVAALALSGVSALVAASLGSRSAENQNLASAAETVALEDSRGRSAAPAAGAGRAPGSAEQGVAGGALAWSLEIVAEEITPARRPAVLSGAELRKGRVVDLRGKGLAGVDVHPLGGRTAAGVPDALATTADDGSFSVALGGSRSGARLGAARAGLSTLLSAVPEALPPGRELLVVAAPAVDLSGAVVGAGGAPVAGARISLVVPDAVFAALERPLDGTLPVERGCSTDAEGAFRLTGLPTHPELALAVSAEGQGEVLVPVPAQSRCGWILCVSEDRGGLSAVARSGARVRQRTEVAERSSALRGRSRWRAQQGGESLALDPGPAPPIGLAKVDGWGPTPGPVDKGGTLSGGGQGKGSGRGGSTNGSNGGGGGGTTWGGTFGGARAGAAMPVRRRIQ
jgi:RNA polymerase sigma-70 factor (ECF subfamily)